MEQKEGVQIKMIGFTTRHKIIQSPDGDVTLLKPTEHGYEPIFMIEDPTPGKMGLDELIGYGEGIADMLDRLPEDVRKQIEV